MNQNIFNLLFGIITLVISIGGIALINYLNQKIDAEKVKSYYDIAKQVVMSIEQSNSQLSGVDKKEFAVNKLIEISNKKISHEQADVLIESSVYEIKKLIQNNLK